MSSLRKTAVAAGMTALVAVAPLLAATDAQALGNNRNVSRSCGTNHVGSGFNGSQNWAQTKKVSGDCAGRLSAALVRSDGYWTTRVYGSKTNAYASYNSRYKAKNGLHWGCDNCNVTYS
ncbi:hypothetical protein [Streptomyces sp. NBC_01353]|uniref:hypothetical protein n=1 Tax=Streptomyces sp. NBC_01353 TaxID=2903835 RepID=UPI002E32AA76|nr:hypothetical protein [Streptomyces sp. NBC_01353]